VETVITQPHQFIRNITEQATDTAFQGRRAAVWADVAYLAQLPVDAPYPLRLRMDQDRGARVGGMIKEKPGISGKGSCARMSAMRNRSG
jgi:hypothetical protein